MIGWELEHLIHPKLEYNTNGSPDIGPWSRRGSDRYRRLTQPQYHETLGLGGTLSQRATSSHLIVAYFLIHQRLPEECTAWVQQDVSLFIESSRPDEPLSKGVPNRPHIRLRYSCGVRVFGSCLLRYTCQCINKSRPFQRHDWQIPAVPIT